MLAAVFAAVVLRTAVPGRYPATPTAWVQTWVADSLDDPGEVCHALFAPSLAAQRTQGRSCMGYYRSIHMVSFRITKTTVTGPVAILAGHDVTRQSAGSSTFTFTLERVAGGWRAVAIASGLHS